MLRSNDSLAPGPAFYSPIVPVVSADPGFGHLISSVDESQSVWANSPTEMMTQGTLVSETAQVELAADGQRLRVMGDDSMFGDQFASMPISVEKNTDYLLRVAVRVEQGPAVSKITSEDRRFMLASDSMTRSIDRAKKKAKKRAKKRALRESASEQAPDVATASDSEKDKNRLRIMQVPFASGDRVEVRFVISNNARSVARPTVEIGELNLFKLGATPRRPLVRGVQRNVYTTSHMLPLVAMGIVLLAVIRNWRAIVVLLAVPIYYLCAQSAFHTEYRYIVAIHYFLFVMAAVALYVFGITFWQGARRITRRKET